MGIKPLKSNSYTEATSTSAADRVRNAMSLMTPAPTPVSSQTTTKGSLNDPSLYSLKHEISQFFDDDDKFEDLTSYPGAERSEYNVALERKDMFSTNLIETLAHMLKSQLCVGILSMHEAYMHGGLLTSLLSTVVITSLAHYNTLMLVRIAQRTYTKMRVPKMSYPDLMEVAVAAGPKCLRKYKKAFRYWVDIVLFLELCMTCNVYQVVMATIIKETMELITNYFASLNLNLRIYVLMVSLPLLPVCLVRNVKYLAPFSLLADLFLVICIIVSLSYALDRQTSLSDLPKWRNIKEFFKFTGIFIYTIDYMNVALPIENNMRSPSFFPLVAWISISLVFVSATTVGFLGYWKWGDNCVSPIIMHIPKNVGAVIMYFLFVITLIASFAVNFWVPFRIIWRYVRKRIKRKRRTWEYIFRVIHFVIITCFSLAYPNFSHLIGLIGNLFLGFITFIFPPIIVTLITRKDGRTWWKR